MPIPPVAAIDYKPNADFILNSTGQMTDPAGAVICDASVSNDACEVLGYGWVYDSPGWKFDGNSGTDGTYYVEGPATISGNPGNPATPIALTIIAEDSIEISGRPDLIPDTPELMFVTDGDLKISNRPTMPLTVEGAILVHEQLDISSRPTLSGRIMVEDAANNSSLVTQNKISDRMTFVVQRYACRRRWCPAPDAERLARGSLSAAIRGFSRTPYRTVGIPNADTSTQRHSWSRGFA